MIKKIVALFIFGISLHGGLFAASAAPTTAPAAARATSKKTKAQRVFEEFLTVCNLARRGGKYSLDLYVVLSEKVENALVLSSPIVAINADLIDIDNLSNFVHESCASVFMPCTRRSIETFGLSVFGPEGYYIFKEGSRGNFSEGKKGVKVVDLPKEISQLLTGSYICYRYKNDYSPNKDMIFVMKKEDALEELSDKVGFFEKKYDSLGGFINHFCLSDIERLYKR